MTEATYDGFTAVELAARLALPQVVVLAETASTMDDAHELAQCGAPAGTLVLALAQSAGRGRSGAVWHGDPSNAILCTLIERPSADALSVLSLRVGLRVAAALSRASGIVLKWPNDLLLEGRKFAGILVEARWRDAKPEWVAVAIGMNLGAPPATMPGAGALPAMLPRVDVLARIVHAMRDAAACTGPLTEAELGDWARRDALRGVRISAPLAGVVEGVDRDGALRVLTENGVEAVRSGSVKFADS